LKARSADAAHSVARMREALHALVDTLQSARTREHVGLRQRIVRWVRRILEVVALLCAAAGIVVAPFNPLVSGILGAGSLVASAASVLCRSFEDDGKYLIMHTLYRSLC
jgi:hypothetical protein